MAVDYRGPNINARRLGGYLRLVREAAELSYEAAAVQVGCDVTWLVRAETGFEPVPPARMVELLDRYGVPRHHKSRTVLVDLASRPDGPPWLAARTDGMKAMTRDLILAESEAAIIRSFGIPALPELVWTEAYARLCLPWRHINADADEIDRQWDLLDCRQRHNPPGRRRYLDVIVDENALRLHTPEPQDGREQFERLLELSADDHASVRVVPMGIGAYVGLDGAFDILEFPSLNDRLSRVHSVLGPEPAPDLTESWKLIEEVALPAAESRDMITRFLTALGP